MAEGLLCGLQFAKSTSALGRELPFAAAPLERQVLGAEFGGT